MKNYLLTTLFVFALVISAMGQTGDTLVDFETVQDPLVEPFDLNGYENAVANPNQTGNTSDYVGKAVKNGDKFWGGINVYFGGNVDLSGSNDTIMIDFYTEDAGVNDSILFKFQLFNRYSGVETVEVDAYYSDANDTQVGAWKTLKYGIPDSISGNYNQMVIFFGWDYASDGDTYYYDNVTVPGYNAYENTDVTFEITDKFNNAEDVKLFIDGSEANLTKSDNVYTNTSSLTSYNVTVGQSEGIYEIVYSHVANGEEIRDTTSVVVGNSTGTQTVKQLIIVEEPEDGTADAINVGDTPPTIDGTVDAVWDSAKTHTLQKRSWWGSPTGLYSMWKIMWDLDNVYLLYMIEDETPHAHNLENDLYINDNIETFFDMDQSASNGFDDNDWQIRTIRGSDIWSGSENVTDTWAADVERAQTEMEGNAGYIVEMAIPWSSLSSSFLPLDGAEFNYDVCVSDVTQEGGTRAYRESWTTVGDSAYYSTADYGTITLVGSSDTTDTGIKVPETLKNVRLYPNPVKENLSVENLENVASISICNVLGARVKEVRVDRDRMNINVEKLSKGMYFVIFRDQKGNRNTFKIMKE
jgi:hypothetical protein